MRLGGSAMSVSTALGGNGVETLGSGFLESWKLMLG